MARLYVRPLDAFERYVLRKGGYPHVMEMKTPLGRIALEVFSFHDVLTINEIFCRGDYGADSRDKVFVDFGSNIGISAAYFLTRSANSFAYLYEPLPFNVERLRSNLQPFEARYVLAERAVGLSEGVVSFGWEESGRYGGVGMPTGNEISVECLDSNTILKQVLAKHGHIDLLKIDIETLEEAVTARIPPSLAANINRIYVEYLFDKNPLKTTHSMEQTGTVSQFLRRRVPG